jgi:hypothetical protein
MKLQLFITAFLLLLSCYPNKAFAYSYNYTNAVAAPELNEGQEPASKAVKKIKKIRKNNTDKKFPLYGTISVSSAVLALFLLGLGIFLRFNIFMAVIAAVLAIAALVMAIIGLKKGESRSFNFIGIMIGAVGLLGAIFFAFSVLS